MADESRSVTRGTLWLLISIAAALIISLATVAAEGAGSWASTIQSHTDELERRESLLEAKVAGLDSKLDAAAKRQEDMLMLLRQHMEDRKHE
jgi:hypothetical protein